MKKRRILKWCLAITMLLTLFAGATQAYADDSTIEIKNFTELMRWVKLSKTESCQEYTFKLMNDIEITEENLQALSSGEYDVANIKVRSVTFGQKNKKFGGVFDGQGHYIKGLTYDASEVGYAADTGLFSYTDGATIKNLVIKEAHIDADYRGGFIVGSADNSTFENITVEDSYMRVSCSNNVLTLVTDGGLVGGAIAGEAVNCVFYNCESNNTTINNNNTAGVSALGGKGLYLGGLVGTADKGTLIEYSRVIGGEVKSYYDVAVGALGGNTIYVGGIVGELQSGSKVLDCFATPYLYTYCATYVSVGGGNSGHIGGIAAAAYGSSCEVERCHFAGEMESQQYNAVLVIPIIQNNINIYGLVDKIPDSLTVKESYYKESTANAVDTFGDNKLSETSSGYGPKDDETYKDIKFWENKGYDFVGNIVRDTKYSTTEHTDGANHSNKWVMDYDQGIPVHGLSAAATFDFPGAGSATIGASTLVNADVTTEDAYHFATQGVNPRNPLDTNRTLNIRVSLNEGYHFYGWYKESDFLGSYVTDISILEQIAHDGTKKFSDAMNESVYMEDNDLYVACVKAEVKFHELDGSEITSATRDYTYEEPLDEVKPAHIPEGAVFYGWTDIPSNEAGGGYSAITSVELTALQQKDAIYFAGDQVTKAMKLYPIFTSYITNINTIFEGNEQDSNPNVTLRKGVGYTTVESDEKGVYIKALAEDGTTAFPDGYRFLGWYQTLEDGTEVLVSTEETYYVPDLTKEVTYTARFEYRVDYYTRAFGQSDGGSFNSSQLYASKWHKYNEGFNNISGLSYMRERVIHWGESHLEHDKDNETCSYYTSENLKINTPMNVYSHNVVDATGGGTAYSIYMDSDFPGAGTISEKKGTASAKYTFTPVNAERYQLQFWTFERKNTRYTYIKNPMDTGVLSPAADYMGRAMVTTELKFHKKVGTDEMVTRRYEDNILMNNSAGYEDYYYNYPHYATGTAVSKDPEDGSDGSVAGYVRRENSPENASMEIQGYAFLGWISDAKIEIDGDEWDYIYNVADDKYCTSDPNRVQPYLVTNDDIVTETMDLYPVYAKYNVDTTTNIEALTVPDDVNKPSIPSYLPNPVTTYDVKEGLATITLTAEHNKTVVIQGQTETYKLVGFTCEVDGKVTDIFNAGTQNTDGNYTFNYEIQAGKSYLFTAIYDPVVVVYHLDNNETVMYVKDKGDQLGYQPEPDYKDISGSDHSIFVGWTNKEPTGNKQWIVDSNKLPILTWETIVNSSMDLYPVFVTGGISVNSNIDDIIDNEEEIRYVEKTDNKFSLVAKKHPGYVFKGWYIGYGTENQTQITEKHIYSLSKEEVLANTVYTAVYEESLQVRYHDLNGNVIYTANVLSSEKRTFVQNMEVPIENEDGVVSTETKEVPIDTDSFTAIEKTLQASQTFIEWKWWNEETDAYVTWDDFKNKPITKVMDLYPVVYQVQFYDAQGTNYTDKMTYVISEKNGKQVLDALFVEKYQQEYLDILVEQQCYDVTKETMIATGRPDVHTNVFVAVKNNDGQTEYIAASDGTEITDDKGKARHYFYAHLIVQKKYTKSDGDISVNQSVDEFVVIRLTNVNTNSVISMPISVQDGNGEVSLKLPAGTYLIEEEEEWSWRDIFKSVEGLDADGKVGLEILDYKTVTFTNERTETKWFSDSVRKENVFKKDVSTTGGE